MVTIPATSLVLVQTNYVVNRQKVQVNKGVKDKAHNDNAFPGMQPM
jgi:hypothetical protein